MTNPSDLEKTTLAALIGRRRSIRAYTERPIGRAAVEQLLFLAQGSAADDGRNAPSAHGVYPLSLFVIVRRLDDASVTSGLHAVHRSSGRIGDYLAPIEPDALLATSLAEDVWLEQAAAVVVVAADYESARTHFADQQADGLRGHRYVHIEAGAVLQNMHLAAVAEGLGGVIIAGFDDAQLAKTLDLPDGLEPVSLFCIGYPAT